ncbi:MAG TPA: BCAM0308 family protein, partial [Usitatibacter sp.]
HSMKSERGGSRTAGREQGLRERRDDSYREDAKMPDPAACPACRATYLKGRWTWNDAPAGAASHKCPACRRVEDDFPAGYVTLRGEFLPRHRGEIVDLVMARGASGKRDHPLQRIIAVKDVAEGLLVTTTDAHLASVIARAVHDAYKGELKLTYSKDENFLRASWTR